MKFQSPPSVRKATLKLPKACFTAFISIPAFREEGDPLPLLPLWEITNFNPRLP